MRTPYFLLTFVLFCIRRASTAPARGHSEVEDLLTWGEQSGVQCNNLKYDRSREVPGLLATSGILGNSVIVSLPRRLALSVSAGQPCPIPHLVPVQLWSSTNKHLQLALLLLDEFKKGTASKWHPYIAALPTSCDTLVHWSEEELEELQYSTTEHEQHFLQKVKHQVDELQDLYWRLQSSALVTQHNTTYDELVWASDIVRSRALAIASPGGWLSRNSITAAAFAGQVLLRLPFFGQFQLTPQISGMCRMVMFVCVGSVLAGANPQGSMDVALLPIIDSIPYNSSSQGHLQVSRFGGSVEAFLGPGGATAGEQVTAAFAPARNEELLQHRGLVETDNIHDFYMANVLEFVKQTAVDQPNEEQLQEVDKRPALLKALTEARLTGHGWQPATLQALRFLYASEEELQAANTVKPIRWMTQLVQQGQLPTFGYYFAQPQSYHTETRVDQVLFSLCREIAQSKPTSLSDDSAAFTKQQQLGSISCTARQKLALQFRQAYKGLLHRCMLQHDVGGTTAGLA
ncbi:hypothetical protein ABBQ38_002543 [Trebouxia sp. C0009 RCD-2024]